MVRFADAPTAAIAVIPTRPVRVVRDQAALARDLREHGELVPPVPNERLVPADFSEEVALTSPIPVPRAHHRDRTAPHRDVAAPHRDVAAPRGASAHPHGPARGTLPEPAPERTTPLTPCGRCRQPPVEARTTSSGWNTTCCRSKSSPRSASFRSRSTAV